MKILQYNILDGCLNKERFKLFDKWMKKQTYDIIGFNEMNQWTQEKLLYHAKEWGYSYSYLFEDADSHYKIGIISKFSIDLITKTNAPFHHGLLHVRINNIHFLLSHFSPHSDERRAEEAQEIVEYINTLGRNEYIIVMGDLNALSRLDKTSYPHKQDKDFKAMNILLKSDLHDTNKNLVFDHSFPTLLLSETKDISYVRIDYILVNNKLKQLNPSSSVIRNEEVERLSDHYPVECHFYFN